MAERHLSVLQSLVLSKVCWTELKQGRSFTQLLLSWLITSNTENLLLALLQKYNPSTLTDKTAATEEDLQGSLRETSELRVNQDSIDSLLAELGFD